MCVIYTRFCFECTSQSKRAFVSAARTSALVRIEYEEQVTLVNAQSSAAALHRLEADFKQTVNDRCEQCHARARVCVCVFVCVRRTGAIVALTGTTDDKEQVLQKSLERLNEQLHGFFALLDATCERACTAPRARFLA